MLGSPIGHSLSPLLHRAAYRALGLAWEYDAIDVKAGELAAFVAGLDSEWVGLSLTMPLKEEALLLGAELAWVSDLARAVAGANTLLATPEGRWQAFNTDVGGIVRALDEAGYVRGPGTATIVGAGATARSAIAACAILGITQIRVIARDRSRAAALTPLIERQGMAALEPLALPDAALPPAAPSWSTVVAETSLWCCTLPADAAQNLADWLAPQVARRSQSGSPLALLDASYHPWPTPMARMWPTAMIASGRDMLLWQAVEQVQLMTGQDPPVDSMMAALPPA